jgi:ribosomal protein S18
MMKPPQCFFCGRQDVNWKDAQMLRKFLSASFKIKARKKTGVCAKHQRDLATAVKLAKQMALLPYLPV